MQCRKSSMYTLGGRRYLGHAEENKKTAGEKGKPNGQNKNVLSATIRRGHEPYSKMS